MLYSRVLRFALSSLHFYFFTSISGFPMNTSLFKRFNRIGASFIAVCGFSLVIMSCGTTGTDPVVTKLDPPAPVDSIFALSATSTSIRLTWKASPTQSQTTFTGYRVTVSGGAAPTTFTVASPSGTNRPLVDITGLVTGTPYTFVIVATNKDTVSAARQIVWAPARRLTAFANGNTARMYETPSMFPSAIQFTAAGAELASIATAGSAADIAIATVGDSLYFGTPRTLYTIATGRATLMDNTGFYGGVDSLNQIFEPVNAVPFIQRNYGVRTGQAKGLLVYFRTASGNLVKMLMKSVGGTLLQGTSPNRFVEVEFSYQPTANIGYTVLLAAPKTQSGEAQCSNGQTNVSPLIADGNVTLVSQAYKGPRNMITTK
jgi:hypothetical protein